jgi:Tfp pilus assembly PilM family ATPase
MLSIGLFDKSIRLLEINKDNKISFAHQIAGDYTINNLILQNKSTETAISKAADSINSILNEQKTNSAFSKLIIDTSYCFTNVIPLDYSESREKINSDIIWELSNYFPDDYKNYKINYHRLLADSFSDNIKETLVIAVKKSLIETIKKLSDLVDTKIKSIDVEHFTSEKYFRNIRKSLLKEENVLIIGCRKNRFDFSIINDFGCFAFEYFTVTNSNFQDKLEETYIKLINKYSNFKINSIYLYGDESTASSYSILNEIEKKSRIILSNPFYEIGITERVPPEIVSEGYKFIPLCGIAME